MPICPCAGINYPFCENFTPNAESVMRRFIAFLRGELSRSTKVFQIELRIANWSFNFVLLIPLHLKFDIVQNLCVLKHFFSNKYAIPLKGSWNIQGFALINEPSWVYCVVCY